LLTALISIVGAQPQATPTITVTINKSMVFRLAEKAKRVSVSQPQVADVLVVAPSQLLINGKAIGTTSLIIFDEKGEVSNYDLVVAPDIAAMRGQLRSVFPGEKVEISTSGPSIVLRGEVSNETVYDKVLEIAVTYLPPKPPASVGPGGTTVTVNPPAFRTPTSGSGFAGGGQIAFDDTTDMTSLYRFPDKGKIEGIVDLLVIREVRQIELSVIVAEVNVDKSREIGFNFAYSGPTQVQSANTFLGSLLGGAATGSFSYVNGAYALTSLYRLLQNKNVAEILAQPRLVIKNGRSGGFLSGGEFPVPAITANTNTVEFKPFGVRLDFVPTITWSNRIDLRVFPEVSEPDASIEVNGVPALAVKRTLSRVEMQEGESLIIAGLLDRRITKSLNKFPVLGDVPILGALFRSTSFANRETELIFVITPRIVRTMKPGEKPALPGIEKYDDPDIRQVPVPGGADERRPSRGATIP
jgi:pilus assembly protein CpaC